MCFSKVKYWWWSVPQPKKRHRHFGSRRYMWGEWYGMARMETTQECVNMLRSNCAIEPFLQWISWPFQRFYLNRFTEIVGILLKCILTIVRANIRITLWTFCRTESTRPVFSDRRVFWLVESTLCLKTIHFQRNESGKKGCNRWHL